MTPTSGLDLETFLRLLGADLGVWLSLGAIVLLLAVMAWTPWGSRKTLGKCLALSVVVHLGLVWQSGPLRGLWRDDDSAADPAPADEGIRRIRVEPIAERDDPAADASSDSRSVATKTSRKALADWDRPTSARLPWLEVSRRPARGDKPATEKGLSRSGADSPVPLPDSEIPEADLPEAPRTARPKPAGAHESNLAENEPKRVADAEPDEIAAAARRRTDSGSNRDDDPANLIERSSPSPRADRRPSPARTTTDRLHRRRSDSTDSLPVPVSSDDPVASGPSPAEPARRSPAPIAENGERDQATDSDRKRGTTIAEVAALTADELPSRIEPRRIVGGTSTTVPIGDRELRRRSRLEIIDTDGPEPSRGLSNRRGDGSTLVAELSRTTSGDDPGLPAVSPGPAERRLEKVPEIYRVRLDRNRSTRALRAGASRESEQAVERALDWLARHQDADGRWNAGTVKRDGVPAAGEENFTMHCPPGEICFGECHYAEADSAITGLALLAFLGAGRSQTDGDYADTVRKGIDFLLSIQKEDGDLRGSSKAVGMYCHAMASLALCEAYALGRDSRLRDPVRRAVAFLARSRAGDGLGWRYLPGDPRGGDTSILGWVVMVLKSAREVGIEIDVESRDAALKWLDKVAAGSQNGLARYRHPGVEPRDEYVRITPTMTAEAWLCRQFLGQGGPGPASDEAAAYLLRHPPGQGVYNLYYYYYATLSMFQRGGDDWKRWNDLLRDDLVRRQKTVGHQAGSWEPDDSPYGAYGGRVYCTALATLTLEVYYRYLRLQNPADQPDAPVIRRAENEPNRNR